MSTLHTYSGYTQAQHSVGTVFTNYQLTSVDTHVNADGTLTITMPVSSNESAITICNGGTGVVTVAWPNGSDTIPVGTCVTLDPNVPLWDAVTPYYIGDSIYFGFVKYWAAADSTGSTPPSADWSTTYVPAVPFSGTYATWNPADLSNVTLSGSDLIVTPNSGQFGLRSTIGKSAGKWYWEYSMPDLPLSSSGFDPYLTFGIANATGDLLWLVPSIDGYGIMSESTASPPFSDCAKVHNDTLTAYGSSIATGVPIVIGVALNMDAGEITFYINGVSYGVAFTGISGTYYAAYSGLASVFVNAVVTANFGASAFSYSVPSGYNSGLYTP